MSWFAIEVHPAAERRDAVAAWLVGRTGHAVEERDDGTLVSFALTAPDADALERDLAREHGPGLLMERREHPEIDWTEAWREGLAVRRIGRFVIVPSWIAYTATAGESVIIIDPEMAFGSGEHGSTRAALALLERFVREGDTVLDLGSGSGILSIVAARLGAGQVVGIEADGDALPVSVQNAERNRVTDRVTFLEGDAAHLTPLLAPVNLVVSNILRLINIALLPEVHSALLPGGIAIFSGMEPAEAPEFRPALLEAGFQIVEELVDEGWWGVAARRP
ncbi:MAG TPA: 50S ribosomal protein L11 methyltransferase [Gemmatimonadales bacterium]|nr:50S ribosomal protein L11 methyltransferase [Gemmatimonadales bacterium]